MADPSAAPVAVPPLRERRKAKARLDIARVALKLFQENGYDATTVGDIAEAADYSVRSFYRYFATKEDVVFLDIAFLLEDVGQAIASWKPTAGGPSLWTVMRDNIVASIDRFQEAGPDFAAAVLRLWMTDPALGGPFYRFCDRWHDLLAAGWSAAYGAGGAAAARGVGAVGDSAVGDAAVGDTACRYAVEERAVRDLAAQQIAHYLVSTCQACFRVHVHTGQDLHGLLVEAYDRFEAGLGGFSVPPEP
jgi:AcrR family transcriptional regulator